MRSTTLLLLSSFLLGSVALGCSTGVTPETATAAPADGVEAPTARAEIPAGTTLTADVQRSTFRFTGAKLTGSHVGGFEIYEATAAWDGKTITSGEIVIDIASLSTDAERLTGHMLSADFFDAEAHPRATFRTSSLTPQGGSVAVVGDLELRGVSQSIEFPAEVVRTADGVKVSARFEIDRQRWGVAYPGMPDDLIKDQVPIEFEVLFTAG
jgi:polyisoprenoid-binding protein YceI